MNYLKWARWGWKLAPWIVMAILGVILWLRPAPGSNSATGQQVVVAGEEALTKGARKWKKRPRPAVCKDSAGEFKMVTREVPPEELERLARQYGFTFGVVSEAETGDESDGFQLFPGGVTTEHTTPQPPQVRVSRMFGEYTAPRLHYGGTFGAALLENGEFEARFDPAPSPKFSWVGSFGVGGLYDFTSDTGNALNDVRHHSLYGFAELFQTKEVYWRIEVGSLQEAAGWDTYVGVKGEWRTEPLWQGLKKGLRSVKVDN